LAKTPPPFAFRSKHVIGFICTPFISGQLFELSAADLAVRLEVFGVFAGFDGDEAVVLNGESPALVAGFRAEDAALFEAEDGARLVAAGLELGVDAEDPADAFRLAR
jgi:hypothetical protein